jgi:hypothetical protein
LLLDIPYSIPSFCVHVHMSCQLSKLLMAITPDLWLPAISGYNLLSWVSDPFWLRTNWRLPAVCSGFKVMIQSTVSQFGLVSGTQMGAMSKFLLLSDSCKDADVGHFHSQEERSVVYNYCGASSKQSFSGQSPAGITTIFICLIWDSANLKGQALI